MTVLLIDDDPAFRSDVAQMLSTAGYEVISAANGAQAIELLEKKRDAIALIVVDLALPDTNGFELIGAISRRVNSIKVIATTGIYRDTDLDAAALLGANAAIRKPAPGSPLPKHQWLETVERLIGKPGREREMTAGSALPRS